MNGVRQEWTKDLTPDDFPGDLRLVAQECGVTVALLLAERMRGTQLYITSADRILMPRKEAFVLDHMGDMSVKELALATGLSERQVYNILERKREDDRQEGLFDADAE